MALLCGRGVWCFQPFARGPKRGRVGLATALHDALPLFIVFRPFREFVSLVNHFSNAKILFQSSFMLMTFHCFSLASVISASLNVPMGDFAPYSNSRALSS